MRTTIAILAVLVLIAPAAAHAQGSRFYVGGTVAVDGGDRGPVPGGAVPSAGLLLGVRLAGGWSVEAEIEQGFRTTSSSSEAFWVAYPPTSTTSHDDFERYGIKARFDRTQDASTGWSAHVMWRTRDAGRVNAGLFAGVDSRFYDSRVVRTTTFVSPLIDLPASHPSILGEDTTRRINAGGFTGGVTILVRTTNRLTLAPDVRLTVGAITDERYLVFKTGMRAMWDF